MKNVVEKTTPCLRIGAKGDISQRVNSLTEKEAMPTVALEKHMRIIVEILNQTEGVEVASTF